MAITNIDMLISGMAKMQPVHFFKVGATSEAAGVMYDVNYFTGLPGQMIANTAGITGLSLDSYSGQFPFFNPPAGENTYLARFSCVSNVLGAFLLCDRLWHNSGILVTGTTAQTIDSVAWPSRCPSSSGGSTPDISGHGVMIAIECSTATTNGSAINNITKMTYTNSEGVSGRVSTLLAWPATAVANSLAQFPLVSGDLGVQSIQSINLGTSYAGGAVHLVAYRPLCRLDCVYSYCGSTADPISGGLPRLYDNTVPFMIFLPGATTAATFWGSINYAQG